MIRAAIAEERVFESWRACQQALVRALAPLTEAQLRQLPLPGRRTPGEIAEHIVFGRALHLQTALGEAAAELRPFVAWNAATEPPRSAAEIVRGLEATWRVIAECVMRGTPTDDIGVGDEPPDMRTVWGLLDHDLPHAGQLSLVLRACGLPGVHT